MEPTNDARRAAVAEAAKARAWQVAVAHAGPIEEVVVLLAHEADANARVLLGALGAPAAAPRVDDWVLVALPRTRLVAVLTPLDPELADKLTTPTPMRLTALVVAFGGWSVVGVGRGVGLA